MLFQSEAMDESVEERFGVIAATGNSCVDGDKD